MADSGSKNKTFFPPVRGRGRLGSAARMRREGTGRGAAERECARAAAPARRRARRWVSLLALDYRRHVLRT